MPTGDKRIKVLRQLKIVILDRLGELINGSMISCDEVIGSNPEIHPAIIRELIVQAEKDIKQYLDFLIIELNEKL